MVKFYRKTVSFSALWVSTNDSLSDFYASSWQRGESVVPMLVVRLLLTISALGILTWSLIEDANPYWLIYLTNWGILLVSATTMSGVVVSFAFLIKKPLGVYLDSVGLHLHWLDNHICIDKYSKASLPLINYFITVCFQLVTLNRYYFI